MQVRGTAEGGANSWAALTLVLGCGAVNPHFQSTLQDLTKGQPTCPEGQVFHLCRVCIQDPQLKALLAKYYEAAWSQPGPLHLCSLKDEPLQPGILQSLVIRARDKALRYYCMSGKHARIPPELEYSPLPVTTSCH